MEEQRQVLKGKQGAYNNNNNNNNRSLFGIKTMETTLFTNSVSDLFQLVCGEVSGVQSFVSSYFGMMHDLNFQEKWLIKNYAAKKKVFILTSTSLHGDQ